CYFILASKKFSRRANMRRKYYKLVPALITLLLLIACGQAENDAPIIPNSPEPAVSDDSAYPSPTENETNVNGYPAPSSSLGTDVLPEPPNPEINFPQADGNNGVVGGVLIREIVSEGFLPLEPVKLTLAEIINTTEGNPAYVRENDQSPQAELFPTGIFIFRNVPPGGYGLMVDVGYTKFPILENGTPLLITVTANEKLDLGQIITVLPNS
ncbi:MAG: hypothetical protein GY943_10995, partial [Chloroflexi bacterium]|nr:hypothetical protein [Chloroflexota bacterium]